MIKVTSKPGAKAGLGLVEGEPVYCLGGVRHEGGVSPVQALVWNVRTCRIVVPDGCFGRIGEGELQAVGAVRGRVLKACTGADCFVVAVMPGNAGGAKGTDYRGIVAGQPSCGGRSQ